MNSYSKIKGREAIALVKDAMEFCDKVPIVYEDHRVKEKEKSLINKNQKNDKPSDINNFECSTTSSLSNIVSIDTTNSTMNLKANSISNTSLTLEYIPQFTELQKKQLDEQLRNVGILLVSNKTYLSLKFSYLFILSMFNYLHKRV